MSFWATFLVAFLVLTVAVLAGKRGYSRGRADGWREGVASVPPPRSTWASSFCASSPVSYPVMTYLIDEDGNLITTADRYLADEEIRTVDRQ